MKGDEQSTLTAQLPMVLRGMLRCIEAPSGQDGLIYRYSVSSSILNFPGSQWS